MKLTNYINDLLYRYDCVIIPDFGGFVTNTVGAVIKNDNSFYPPSKQVGFNEHLTHNDGLLANYIASAENISFEKATTAISLSVIKWKKALQSEKLVLDNLGSLILNSENKIVFEPSNAINFLTHSFGLSTFNSDVIVRQTEVKPLVVLVEENRKIPVFVKYVASVAVICALGFATFSGIQKHQTNKDIANQKEILEKKIQSATFVISDPLPIINLDVVKKEIEKPYYIVAGAFQFEENAEKKVKQLIKKGYNAEIIGKNKWGLTQVTFDSFADKTEAEKFLFKLKRTVSKDAWLLLR
ncbi:SPOR domain-containing protein [Polaribacter sp.]|nr:SPOR domain-containing protein [Polaribacter sp.]